ncbi:MAG: aspartate--tRNA ligase, partial [Proteobacteria bacterium]|nr:aspartate--tRNA ligase [Pseudomonadota bacterium]
MQPEPLLGLKRSHSCGALRADHCGETVTLMGWVHRRRDLGGLIFIDLRDRDGITQIIFSPQQNAEIFENAKDLRNEFVIAVTGVVDKRGEGTVNTRQATGEIEVRAQALRLLNTSKVPPIPINEDKALDDGLRMKYRFLDLRRGVMQQRIITRHKVGKAMREFLSGQGFLEIETPMLVRSTPEGARDYLVPSRVNPGRFYALPQSPQLFKQLLMVSGLERYFQIARCFRDEDLRADRQPEFTQLDLEMSFVEQDDVFNIIEGTLKHVFKQVLDLDLQTPFPRMPYYEAAERYGSDKPDTRFGMEIFDVTETLRGVDFAVFKGIIEGGGLLKGIAVPGGASLSRKETDELTALVKGWGAGGLFTIGLQEDGTLRSSLAKYLDDATSTALREKSGAKNGDMLFLVGGDKAKALEVLGKLRLEMGRRLKLIPMPGTVVPNPETQAYNFLWVVNFPQFQWNAEEQRLEAEHHPFTSPLPEDIPLMKTEPLKVRSSAYDLVLNGNELGSGSIRIHQRPLQELVFEAIGLDLAAANEKFGFLMEAFEFGAPPHGGIALGFDRLTALMSGIDSIREVIAFPKNQNAVDMLTGAPVEPTPEQLAL